MKRGRHHATQGADKEGDEYSSAATVNIPADHHHHHNTSRKRKHESTTTTTTSMHKVHRSTVSLPAPRRPGGRMNDKLHELRSLVPNITKKDKASIIGGATLYMQELEIRAKKLEAHIASFDDDQYSDMDKPQQRSYQIPQKISSVKSFSSTSKKIVKMARSREEGEVDKPQHPSYQTPKKNLVVDSSLSSTKIEKMEVTREGERGVSVKLVCNKGHGVAISLYTVLESFTSLNVESSKLFTVPEGFELTFTLKVGKLEANLEKLKLRVVEAFLKGGFDFKTSPQP